jgi:SAM-dependent methyltransferase
MSTSVGHDASGATTSPLATPLPWDLVSTDYAAEVVPHFEQFAREALRLAGVTGRTGARVVDVACGPGTLAALAAREGATVSAIDFSERMVAKARERIANEKLERIDVRVGDGQALPYDDARFDAAFSMFGLMFFPDRARGFREIARVLVPGGKAVVASWTSLDRVPLFAEIFTVLREALPGLPSQGIAPLSTAEEARGEMSASLGDVVVHEVTFAFEAESADAFWGYAQRTVAPLVLLRNKLGPDAWAPVAARIEARLRATAGAANVSMPMTALLTVGAKR